MAGAVGALAMIDADRASEVTRPVSRFTTGRECMEIPKERYQAIENEIASDSSPVGIDAKKTHVMIIHQLRLIEERLNRIEEALHL